MKPTRSYGKRGMKKGRLFFHWVESIHFQREHLLGFLSEQGKLPFHRFLPHEGVAICLAFQLCAVDKHLVVLRCFACAISIYLSHCSVFIFYSNKDEIETLSGSNFVLVLS